METLTGDSMGTGWTVKLVLPPGAWASGLAQQVRDGITALLAIIVAQMSNWESASDISRFNRSPPGQWQAMPAQFLHVLRAGLDIAARSGGAFDPAIGAAVDRWGFGPGGIVSQPAPRAPAHGWTSIETGAGQARRLTDVALDFSGIAKGFAVDAVAKYLRERGIIHHLVEIGGELRGEGLRPDGQPWWVDLEIPPGLALTPLRLGLTGLAVATSGDYRRFFERDGQRYAHNIDPATGAPVRNGLASVTVCDASAMRADAWATALYVRGADDGLALADREGLAALFVLRAGADGREKASAAFRAMLA